MCIYNIIMNSILNNDAEYCVPNSVFEKSKSDLIYIHTFYMYVFVYVCYHLSFKIVGYRNELRLEV